MPLASCLLPDRAPAPSAQDSGLSTHDSFAGVYVLGLEGRPLTFLRPYLEHSDVDGVSLRARWYQVEPAEGVYDWSMFDSVIGHADACGKKIMLRVLPGVHTPQWVYAAGAARFEYIDRSRWHDTHGQTLIAPVPWDPVYLDKWSNFVAAFGTRYADHPAVSIVAVTGPAAGGEMHLPGKHDAAGWRAVGYSEAVLIDAWRQTIDAFCPAFPGQHLSVAIAHPVGFGRPAQVVDAVTDYCARQGVGLQGNWLSAKTSPRFVLYRRVGGSAADAPTGFQMLCSATQSRFGGSLRRAVDVGLRARASFLELNRVDIAQFPADVARAHRLLLGRDRPVAAGVSPTVPNRDREGVAGSPSL